MLGKCKLLKVHQPWSLEELETTIGRRVRPLPGGGPIVIESLKKETQK